MPTVNSPEQRAIDSITKALGSLVLERDSTGREAFMHNLKRIEMACKEARFSITIKPIVDDVEDDEL